MQRGARSRDRSEARRRNAGSRAHATIRTAAASSSTIAASDISFCRDARASGTTARWHSTNPHGRDDSSCFRRGDRVVTMMTTDFFVGA
jgi:hypothetical protein